MKLLPLSAVILSLAVTTPVQAKDLAGTVTDSVSGAPLEGASVMVLETGDSMTTSLGGQYHFTSIPDGPITLLVGLAGYRPQITPSSCCQNRGNADSDCTFGCVTVADLSYLVSYLFSNGPPPACEEEGNADSDCTFGCVTVADLSYLVSYLFSSGPAPGPC